MDGQADWWDRQMACSPRAYSVRPRTSLSTQGCPIDDEHAPLPSPQKKVLMEQGVAA